MKEHVTKTIEVRARAMTSAAALKNNFKTTVYELFSW